MGKLLTAILPLLALTACGPAPILLYTGTGASPNDVAAIENVLAAANLSYATATSPQLNAMPESQLAAHRLLILPGGNFIEMGNSLTPATAAHIRNAVTNGTNYLGICAGGLLAGNFPPPYNSFNLTNGVKFGFYQPAGPNTRKAAVKLTTPNGPAREYYWEDGPQFTGWGEIVAKYPDGTPAIVQGPAGRGWVLLTGVHPEAPAKWLPGLQPADAQSIIHAALNRTRLPHF